MSVFLLINQIVVYELIKRFYHIYIRIQTKKDAGINYSLRHIRRINQFVLS
jgi:hypothetical protein